MPPLCYAVEAGRAQMGRQGTWKVATCIFVRLRQMHKKPKRAKCQQKSPASSTTSWNVDVISALGDSSRKKSYSSWWQTSRYFLMLGNFFSPIFHGFFRLFTGPSFFLKPPKASLQMARWGHQSRIRWGLVGWLVGLLGPVKLHEGKLVPQNGGSSFESWARGGNPQLEGTKIGCYSFRTSKLWNLWEISGQLFVLRRTFFHNIFWRTVYPVYSMNFLFFLPPRT